MQYEIHDNNNTRPKLFRMFETSRILLFKKKKRVFPDKRKRPISIIDNIACSGFPMERLLSSSIVLYDLNVLLYEVTWHVVPNQPTGPWPHRYEVHEIIATS